ncbi:MAG TPA: ABC transporter substrate-binding protein [Thermoanaerobaculia bacterium]|nr:ABC transporter substrate-binding protein [Thermoanaerobaculia bacterium]
MNVRKLLLCSLILALTLPAAAQRRRSTGSGSVTLIDLGGLFSLTGDGATLGAASAASLELAARDINAEFDALDVPYRVTTSIVDSQLVPSVAADQFAILAERGVPFVIGPQSSAEAAAIRESAGEHDVIVISQGSTASTLAIAGDNLFRLAPNDRLEGDAMASLMRADGIDTMLPMWRDDTGNRGLYTGVTDYFRTGGGTVLTGLSYDPATTDFTSQVTALGAALRAWRAEHPNAKIGVYVAAFEEAVEIFKLARLDADLSSVRWYAGDGITRSQAILNDTNAMQFAASTFLTAPNVGLDEVLRDRWEPIQNELALALGFVPDTYALSVYDAAWVAALSAVEVQLRRHNLREAFVRNIQRYWGLTGPTALDAAGDRKLASFDLWTVRLTIEGGPEWVRTAQFTGGRIAR